MDQTTGLTRAIRINVIGGSLLLFGAALMLALVASGHLAMDASVAMSLGFGFVMAGLMFFTARGLRQDRDDPAGAERRFQTQAVGWTAALLTFAFLAIVGVIAWGLLR